MYDSDDRLLGERFARLLNSADDSDWDDVRRRAQMSSRVPKALFAAASLLAVIAVIPAFGLAGRIIGLFNARGKHVPVAKLTRLDRDLLVFSFCRHLDLATKPGHPPEQRCREGGPKIEEIANNGTRLYWKVTYRGGRTCLASGPVHGYRDPNRGISHIGEISCTPPQKLFPTPTRPITTDIAVEVRPANGRARLLHLSGLAGQGVGSVGLVENRGSVFKTPVKGRTYEFALIPNRAWVAIAAFDASGKEVYRERLPADRVPAARALRRANPVPLPALPALPAQPPFQHGEAPGATMDVYRSGLVAVHLTSLTSRAVGLLRPPRRRAYRFVSIQCADVAYGAGRWATVGSGTTAPFRANLRVLLGGEPGGGSPPFDVCSVKGTYGWRWNAPHGMHDAVEVAFTPLGRRFFAEQAAARDLAFFVRSPAMTTVRDAVKRGASVPPAKEITRGLTGRVVPLSKRRAVLPVGEIGVWTDSRSLIVAAERAADGRRLYVTLRSGRVGPHNLRELAFVF